jgi:hypothetical protein
MIERRSKASSITDNFDAVMLVIVKQADYIFIAVKQHFAVDDPIYDSSIGSKQNPFLKQSIRSEWNTAS